MISIFITHGGASKAGGKIEAAYIKSHAATNTVTYRTAQLGISRNGKTCVAA